MKLEKTMKRIISIAICAFIFLGCINVMPNNNASLTAKADSVFKSYAFSETEIKKIASLCQQEQGTAKGAAAEASLMANRFELYGSKYSSVYDYARNSGWFAKAGTHMDKMNATDAVVAAVRSVLIDGKRTIPGYIDEHDCFSDLSSCTNNGKSITITNRSQYQQFVTIIKNKYGSTYTFYCFPTNSSDPFGYISQANRNRIGDAYYDYDTGKLINGGNEAPIGVLDSYGSDGRTVSVHGWCYDPSNLSAQLAVHLYLRDSGGGMHCLGELPANCSRPDVNNVYGCGEYHGFDGGLNVGELQTGEYTVMVAFLDTEEGGANATWRDGGTIFIQADTEGPMISDVKLIDVSKDGYTVQCKVTDNKGISKVQFPTWTENNGQDDIQADWGNNPAASGTIEGDTVSYRVNISDHNNEYGIYNTHIYAFDSSGNSTAIGVAVCIEDIAPEISEVRYYDVSPSGYTIECTVTDEGGSGIDRVQFPTWTENNGQDDIDPSWGTNQLASGKIDGNKVTYRVNVSDHNNELGIYNTHIYAYDNVGNVSSFGIALVLEDIAPEISNVRYYDVSSSGYTVECTVVDKGGSGLDRVQFPTWTENNGQDDIQLDWVYGESASGTIDGNKVTYRVNTADHNNEFGEYVTHIYAWDKSGNYTCFGLGSIIISSGIIGDSNNDGEVNVADLVMLQKWLLTENNELTCWQNVDLCEDGVIDVFDIVMLRRLLIKK